MKIDKYLMGRNIKRIFLGICVLFFLLSFAFLIQKNLSSIFNKNLYWDDESTNSVVSANLTRKIFPPMVRINSLSQKFSDWRDGPYWQHIPPLFTYVPLPGYILDHQVTIEVKRLSYATVLMLTGLLFILTIYWFDKKITSTLAATIAAACFIFIKFSQNLISGVDFGNSDILLAFNIVLSFAAICWYLKKEQGLRIDYSIWKLILIGFIVSLPIITKNILGAIPATTFFLLLINDHRKINIKVLISFFSVALFLVIAYLPLYISSPETFKEEIFLPFVHMKNYEGWEKPWHYFITHYIQDSYLGSFTIFYYLSILTGLFLLIKKKIKDTSKIIVTLSIVWFIWSLVAISCIKSKAPNFIYQSFLLSLFFVVYTIIFLFSQTKISLKITEFVTKINKNKTTLIGRFLIVILIILLGLNIYYYRQVIIQFQQTRNSSYIYESEHEKYYHFAETIRRTGVNTNDLFLLAYSQDDYWFRYYIMFLTGSEARTLREFKKINPTYSTLQNKYQRIFIVSDKYGDYKELNIPYFISYIGRFRVLEINTKDLDNNYVEKIIKTLPGVKNHFAD